MARRRRTLSRDERELWDRVRASAAPLRPERIAEPAPPAPLPPPAPARAAEASSRPAAAKPAGTATKPPPAALDAVPRMDRRRFEKLRRGRLEPEARLDLHGLTAGPAHAALTRFILNAHAEGLRLVLVITGKGRDPEAEASGLYRHGILRHSVPHWLAAPPLVGRTLEVVPAHQRHGGAGAYYVYLRRPR